MPHSHAVLSFNRLLSHPHGRVIFYYYSTFSIKMQSVKKCTFLYFYVYFYITQNITLLSAFQYGFLIFSGGKGPAEKYTFLFFLQKGPQNMKHSTRKLDLTGQRFGRLTVLTQADNIGQKTAWLCRCDCGRKTVVRTSHLRCGHTTGCGCCRKSGITALTYVDGTCVEMLRARTIRSNNTSGVPGVDWRASKGLWRAAICFKGKRYYLGSYQRFEDAVRARKQAEENLHDRFLQEFSEAAPQF